MIKKSLRTKCLFLAFFATIPTFLIVIGSTQGMNNIIDSANADITEYSIHFSST